MILYCGDVNVCYRSNVLVVQGVKFPGRNVDKRWAYDVEGLG